MAFIRTRRWHERGPPSPISPLRVNPGGLAAVAVSGARQVVGSSGEAELQSRTMSDNAADGMANMSIAAAPSAAADWKERLTAEEYKILREKGTEAEGTGEYDRFYPTTGYFVCRGCGNPLFSAGAKFKSGCGWPSFDRCYVGSIYQQPDLSHGLRRIELVCMECKGCLLYTSPSPRDQRGSRMPSSA